MASKLLWEKFCGWLAWHLPRSVVYHCLIRAWAHGTSGQFGNTVAPSLTMEQAIERWDIPHRPMNMEELAIALRAGGPPAASSAPRNDMGREVLP